VCNRVICGLQARRRMSALRCRKQDVAFGLAPRYEHCNRAEYANTQTRDLLSEDHDRGLSWRKHALTVCVCKNKRGQHHPLQRSPENCSPRKRSVSHQDSICSRGRGRCPSLAGPTYLPCSMSWECCDMPRSTGFPGPSPSYDAPVSRGHTGWHCREELSHVFSARLGRKLRATRPTFSAGLVSPLGAIRSE